MSAIRIRKVVPRDLPRVAVLAGRLVREHHAYDPARFMKPVDPERGYEQWLAKELRSPEVILLAAVTTGAVAAAELSAAAESGASSAPSEEVVGYAYARMQPRSYDELLEACTKLHDVYVDARARRLGAGEALLRETIRLAALEGAPRILLLTASQNEDAHRLFRRFGFRTTMLEMTRETLAEDARTPGERPVR